jgi:hypothetical protein
MVWSAVFFVIGCNDNDGTCSALGVGVLGSNVIFALGCGYTVAKAFQQKNHLGEKLDRLSSALSRLTRRTGGRSRASEERGGDDDQNEGGGEDEEFHFEATRVDDDAEIGCTIKINPLAGGATRSEFEKRRKSRIQRRQVVSSGFGSGGGSGGSSSNNNNNINVARTTPAEIEMTSGEKKKTEEESEEEQLQIFVDANTGNSYFVNSQTGETEWVQ